MGHDGWPRHSPRAGVCTIRAIHWPTRTQEVHEAGSLQGVHGREGPIQSRPPAAQVRQYCGARALRGSGVKRVGICEHVPTEAAFAVQRVHLFSNTANRSTTLTYKKVNRDSMAGRLHALTGIPLEGRERVLVYAVGVWETYLLILSSSEPSLPEHDPQNVSRFCDMNPCRVIRVDIMAKRRPLATVKFSSRPARGGPGPGEPRRRGRQNFRRSFAKACPVFGS